MTNKPRPGLTLADITLLARLAEAEYNHLLVPSVCKAVKIPEREKIKRLLDKLERIRVEMQ